MGWAPGKGLGNGLQGETDNIKVALKDDLLGLGAKKEYGGGLWRGTAEVDDLYRRLEVGGVDSQKQEEVKVEEAKPEVKMRGGWKMRFLVGDTYTSSFSTEVSTAEVSEVEAPSSVEESSGDVKESKKRKRGVENGEKKKRSKKEKSDKKDNKPKEGVDNAASEPNSGIGEVRRKKDKKRSKSDTATSQEQDEVVLAAPISDKTPIATTKKDKKMKKDKKNRKTKSREEKADEPEKQKKRKDKSKANEAVAETPLTSDSKSFSATTPISEPTTVTTPDRSETIPRQMHRARFLAMKRASVMDPNALREILGMTG